MFTVNTAYLKQITASGIGLVLGASLLVLAGGAKVFGMFSPSAHSDNMVAADRGDDVHEHMKRNFFVMAAICQLVALLPATFCWWTQAAAAKEKMLKEQSDDDL